MSGIAGGVPGVTTPAAATGPVLSSAAPGVVSMSVGSGVGTGGAVGIPVGPGAGVAPGGGVAGPGAGAGGVPAGAGAGAGTSGGAPIPPGTPIITNEWILHTMRQLTKDAKAEFEPQAVQMMAAISASFIDETLSGIAAAARARAGPQQPAVMSEEDLVTFLECRWPELREAGDPVPRSAQARPQSAVHAERLTQTGDVRSAQGPK